MPHSRDAGAEGADGIDEKDALRLRDILTTRAGIVEMIPESSPVAIARYEPDPAVGEEQSCIRRAKGWLAPAREIALAGTR
jgi:hypothetical protein